MSTNTAIIIACGVISFACAVLLLAGLCYAAKMGDEQ